MVCVALPIRSPLNSAAIINGSERGHVAFQSFPVSVTVSFSTCDCCTMMALRPRGARFYALFAFLILAALFENSHASLGDHLPEFRECVNVCVLSNHRVGSFPSRTVG